jgi:hypothetical protein
MPVFDVRCSNQSCAKVEEVSKAFEADHRCQHCGCSTKTLMPRMNTVWKDNSNPFDMVDENMSLPDTKKIKSFGNDRRKGGKDMT